MKCPQSRNLFLSAAAFAAIVTIGAPARAADIDAKRLLEAGFHMYLRKPIDQVALVAAVAKLASVARAK